MKNVTIDCRLTTTSYLLVLLTVFTASAYPSFASDADHGRKTTDSGVLVAVTKLDPIVVSAMRRDVRTKDAPHSVYVQEADQLSHKQARNLPEALAQTPGVMVQKTANGHGSPFIRGFTGYRTLTLLDGIRYNNSVYRDGPNEYFSLIDLNSVESLTLLSGPSSVLYGSDSIGGTVYLA
ncbi:MAG: Plug domain-containing protein, partial [Parvibaculaceae bacterium]|nr:Plug domain-containing protein [Parvibaculaceae bacterium]